MKQLNITSSKAWRAAAPLVSATLVAGGLVFLSGCATEPESHIVSAPPPNVQMPAATAPTQIVVTQAPAPVGTVVYTQVPSAAPQMVVAQSARPSPDYSWVDGHWTYHNGRYEWINGQWERPPYARATWVPPYSETRSDGSFLFYEGRWASN